MSTLVYGVTKIISREQETFGGRDEVLRVVADAYDQLRHAYREGTLRIHLSVEGYGSPDDGNFRDTGSV